MAFALLVVPTLLQPFFVNGAPVSSPPPVALGSSRKPDVRVQISDLHLFTHFASIPAISNPATIKFERLEATKLLTKAKYASDSRYCEELKFRDPGGSMYCPYSQSMTSASAYRVTYSYRGRPLGSDEYDNRYFTFQVYFRPGELPSALQKVLSTGKSDRGQLAPYFKLSTSRRPVQATVIDREHSYFCTGYYLDGAWVHDQPKCNDRVVYKTVLRASDYIAVQVEPFVLPSQH
jgi:hypothetical protein